MYMAPIFDINNNPLEGSIIYEGDIISPIYIEWTLRDLPTE